MESADDQAVCPFFDVYLILLVLSVTCIVEVRKDAIVRDLKLVYQNKSNCNVDMLVLTFQGRELKNDDATLAECGMTKNSTVFVSARVESGLRERTPIQTPSAVLAAELFISHGAESLTQMQSIRDAIRGMHALPVRNVMLAKPPTLEQKDRSLWTPEKQMEHQVTRNRMKDLLKRRSAAKAKNMPPRHTETDVQCGSVGRSPISSEPGTPNNEFDLTPRQTPSTSSLSFLSSVSAAIGSATAVVEPSEGQFGPKEALLYFDPPETAREMIVLQQDLFDPPKNREELMKVKREMESRALTQCGVCRKRLPISQQTLRCACNRVFCARHRNPEDHRCNLDYKLTGRKKLHKENPKLQSGGAHKAKPE